MPVALKVQLGATPVVTLHTHNATLQLQPFVEVLAVASNSAFQSLFSFDMVSQEGWWGWLEGGDTPHPTSCPTFLTCSALFTLVTLCKDLIWLLWLLFTCSPGL